MKSKLVSQEDFMKSAENKRLVVPMRFANGYFVKGEINAQKVYATINDRNFKLMHEEHTENLIRKYGGFRLQ